MQYGGRSAGEATSIRGSSDSSLVRVATSAEQSIAGAAAALKAQRITIAQAAELASSAWQPAGGRGTRGFAIGGRLLGRQCGPALGFDLVDRGSDRIEG